MGIRALAKRTLERIEDRRYKRRLRERQTAYGEWAAEREAEPLWQDRVCSRDFAVFCAEDGRMAAGALAAVEAYFAARPEVRILYGDEDVWDSVRELPWYKPDWSPDVLDCFFYFGSLVAVERELLEEAGIRPEEFCCRRRADSAGSGPAGTGTARRPGSCREPRDSARDERGSGCRTEDVWQVRDFEAYEQAVHACLTLAGGYEKAASCVGHVQRILFHGRGKACQERFFQSTPFRESLKEQRLQNLQGILAAERGRVPALSVVIPSKDQPQALEACIEGCLQGARSRNGRQPLSVEIILVDNGSTRENRERIETMAHRLSCRKRDGCPVRYLYQPMEFNFSRMCNLGAAVAGGRLLLFLNDDVTLSQAGTLEEMAALAVREGTGAVGLKLYYPDCARIQHGGIVNLSSGPVDPLRFCPDEVWHYYGANRGNRNVLAVTGACLMTEREKFREAGGFSEELRVAFNDVELCFRLYEAGYRNVCVNEFHGCHHESLSRGDDGSGENLKRLGRERERLYACHPALAGEDPYYPPGLNREGLFTSGIRPAYLTAGNEIQKALSGQRRVSLEGYRQDACLSVSVEDCRGRRVRGFAVVLGDNNAHYVRSLLLGEVPEAETESRPPESGVRGKIYALETAGMYRPDLEENMPDQRNVALCGFDVEIGENAVPAGKYRLGMAARNRAGGVRLFNWSGCYIELT